MVVKIGQEVIWWDFFSCNFSSLAWSSRKVFKDEGDNIILQNDNVSLKRQLGETKSHLENMTKRAEEVKKKYDRLEHTRTNEKESLEVRVGQLNAESTELLPHSNILEFDENAHQAEVIRRCQKNVAPETNSKVAI